MDRSDSESESEVVEIPEPEDLFYDEADEDRPVHKEDEAKEASVNPKEEKSKTEGENKPKPKKARCSRGISDKTLTKPNGLPALKKLFENFKFKGTGHEEEDLTRIMAILQRWMCYQLCPSYDFETCMRELEALGKKRIVQTLMRKYRLGIEDWGEKIPDNVDQDKQDDGVEISKPIKENDFDLLLNEEITNVDSDGESQQSAQKETEVVLTPEQLERIARNRKLAEEKRMKRISQQQSTISKESTSANDSEIIPMELDYT